mmetsp:Transcript_12778/g.15167  ORF Transcript_12778/g.15167 Transcript_12778/m.15167 type:complete len:330 (+) Transcript_12778:122-1111(+)
MLAPGNTDEKEDDLDWSSFDEIDDDIDTPSTVVKGADGKASNVTQQLESLYAGVKRDLEKVEKAEKHVEELLENRNNTSNVLRYVEAKIKDLLASRSSSEGSNSSQLHLLKQMDVMNELNQNAAEYSKTLKDQLDLVNELNSSLVKENKQLKQEANEVQQKYKNLRLKARKWRSVSATPPFSSRPTTTSSNASVGGIARSTSSSTAPVGDGKLLEEPMIISSLRAQNITQKSQIMKMMKEQKQLKDRIRALEEQLKNGGTKSGGKILPPINAKISRAQTCSPPPGSSNGRSSRHRSGSAPKSPIGKSSSIAGGYSDFLLKISNMEDGLL